MTKPTQQAQELVPYRSPWERRSDETAKAFHAFAVFRDFGASRSLSQVAEYLVENAPERKHATVLSQLKKWSTQHRWVDRAEAYDAYLDQRRRERAETEMDKAQQLYFGIAGGLTSRLAQRLEPNPPEGVELLDVNDMNGVVKFVRAVGQLQIIGDRSSPASHRSLGELSSIPRHDFVEAFEGLYDGLMRFIPEEHKPFAAQWVQLFLEGRF